MSGQTFSKALVFGLLFSVMLAVVTPRTAKAGLLVAVTDAGGVNSRLNDRAVMTAGAALLLIVGAAAFEDLEHVGLFWIVGMGVLDASGAWPGDTRLDLALAKRFPALRTDQIEEIQALAAGPSTTLRPVGGNILEVCFSRSSVEDLELADTVINELICEKSGTGR
jgi:hypothetical protein